MIVMNQQSEKPPKQQPLLNGDGDGDGDSDDGDNDGGGRVGNHTPINFATVEDRIYRSGFPKPADFPFLQTLNLKSVIFLCKESYPKENLDFLNSHNIRLFQFGIDGHKDAPIPKRIISEALKVLIDDRNHPLLIHCKCGYHRTGCFVGCLRKLQNWCLPSVLEEYKFYAGKKSREMDLKFLETYDVTYVRQFLHSIIYQYHGYGSKKRRLMYKKMFNINHKSVLFSPNHRS